ncbi:hypothetical protein Tco_0174459 [Tanacetum coccineum]
MGDININMLTIEQYLALIRRVRLGMVIPKLGNDVDFEIKSQFMRAARKWKNLLLAGSISTWDLLEKAFIRKYCPPLKPCPQHDLNNHHKVQIFYKGLDIPSRKMGDSQRLIPMIPPAQALKSIQIMADHSQNCKKPFVEEDAVRLNDRCSVALQNQPPPKENDPGSFTLPCLIEMADTTMKAPRRIIENVLVQIDKFIFPVDFIIMDMVEDPNAPLILGRHLLATAHAHIDIFNKEISLGVGEERILFKMNELVDDPCITHESVCKIEFFRETHEEELELLLASYPQSSFTKMKAQSYIVNKNEKSEPFIQQLNPLPGISQSLKVSTKIGSHSKEMESEVTSTRIHMVKMFLFWRNHSSYAVTDSVTTYVPWKPSRDFTRLLRPPSGLKSLLHTLNATVILTKLVPVDAHGVVLGLYLATGKHFKSGLVRYRADDDDGLELWMFLMEVDLKHGLEQAVSSSSRANPGESLILLLLLCLNFYFLKCTIGTLYKPSRGVGVELPLDL